MEWKSTGHVVYIMGVLMIQEMIIRAKSQAKKKKAAQS